MSKQKEYMFFLILLTNAETKHLDYIILDGTISHIWEEFTIQIRCTDLMHVQTRLNCKVTAIQWVKLWFVYNTKYCISFNAIVRR